MKFMLKRPFLYLSGFLLFVVATCTVLNKCSMSSHSLAAAPFSYEELSHIPNFQLQAPSFLSAADGTAIAYYAFVPENPSAIVILYHGSGLYTDRSYQYVGSRLQADYNIGCYCVDIRGHGNSGGPRGDASSIDQVLEDVSTILTFAKNAFPSIPVYLAGHSSGAGLLLNYSAYNNKKSDLYEGYILLAPYLGPRVGVERPEAPIFVKKVKVWIFLLNLLLRLSIYQHVPAVFFNYSSTLLAEDPLIVSTYSYIMSSATTPNNPATIFERLDKPCMLYIGSDDEQFDPEKVTAFANYNTKNMVSAKIIPGAKHLSILLDAPQLFAHAITP